MLAAVLTLIHGLYPAVYLLWAGVLILLGMQSAAPPILNPLALVVLDAAVYLFIGVGLLRGRNYFVFAILWTIWGGLLATFVATYKNAVLNVLSFLIVFSCTYHHVTVNSTNRDVVKKIGQFAAVLALVQGIFVALAFATAQLGYVAMIRTLMGSSYGQFIYGPSFIALLATAAIYLALGAGMLKGKEEVFFVAIFWIIVESVLALADSSYLHTHFNVISMLILAFAAYYYFSKAKT